MSESHDLQSRIEALEQRVANLEGRRREVPPAVPFPATPAPPPIVRQARLQEIQTVAPRAPYEPVDGEREFGAKVLPWIGAVAVVVGLGYLVNYAIQRDLITPEMQMAGAAIFSLIIALIGGFVARGEDVIKRAYGNLLVGLGSCGLYMTSAGGYSGWNLISAETMVVTFVVLSMVNLAYGFWRSLPPFVVLGMAGGAIAASMVASKGQYDLSSLILGIVGSAALGVLVSSRQSRWVPAVWLIGSMSLISWSVAREATGSHYVVAGWLVANVLAYVFGSVREGREIEPVAPGVMSLAAIGNVFICADNRWEAGLIALGFAAVFGGFAYRFAAARKSLAILAAVFVAIIAPFGLETSWYILTFAVLGTGLLVAAIKSYAEIAILAAVNLFIAGLLYLTIPVANSSDLLPFDERYLVALLTVVAVVATALVHHMTKSKLKDVVELDKLSLMLGAGTVWCFVWRFVHLEIQAGFLGREWITISWGICALLAIATGAWAHLKTLRFAGLGILMASFARVVMVELAELESIYKVMLLIGLGLLALGISYGFYIRPGRKGPLAH